MQKQQKQKEAAEITKIDTFAKVVRTVTVPPIMALTLMVVLFAVNGGIFHNSVWELLMSILFLVLIPITAYPLQPLIPKYKDKGREGQRNLAFILTLGGYTAALIYMFVVNVSKYLALIYYTYVLSVLVLLFFNKVIKFRSSGHVCGIAGPLIIAVYLIGWKAIAPCCILFALICWASLRLKRHSPIELVGGCISCGMAFVCGILLVTFVG